MNVGCQGFLSKTLDMTIKMCEENSTSTGLEYKLWKVGEAVLTCCVYTNKKTKKQKIQEDMQGGLGQGWYFSCITCFPLKVIPRRQCSYRRKSNLVLVTTVTGQLLNFPVKDGVPVTGFFPVNPQKPI